MNNFYRALVGLGLLVNVMACQSVLGIGNTIHIVASLPLTARDTTLAQSLDRGIRYALAEHGTTVGNYTIVYETYDNAVGNPTTDWWQEFSNAYRGVADKTVLAYIGVPTSYAARSTIPILNEGGPLVMISSVNSYPGFTKNFAEGEPETYYPVGRRNFARVIPSGDVLATASARWAQANGFHTVAILHDEEWDNRALASSFESKAQAAGLRVLASETYSPTLPEQNAIFLKVAAARADLVFLAADESSEPLQVVQSLRGSDWKGTLLTTSNLAVNSFVQDPRAEGVLIALGGMSAEDVALASADGKKWYDGYLAKFASPPDYQSLEAYEATRVVLQAIGACIAENNVTRLCVNDKTLATKNFPSLFGGTWSFDANGDTTMNLMNVYAVKDGKLVRVEK